MNILVTGGAGYIGSHTCKALARAGHLPVTFDNLSTGHRWAVRWGPLMEADLLDAGAIESALRQHRIDAVIHFAALAYVGESMIDPGRYFRNNVVGSLNLLQAMYSAGVERLVFSSTCASYGIPESVPIDESHPQRPINPYGESKRFVERSMHWFGIAHGMRWIALRYFNAAGADADGEIGELHEPETHLLPLAIETALGRRSELAVLGTDYPTPDGTAVRDYVHVDDLADAHVSALDHLARGGRSTSLNLGSGNGHSVREVIAAVERACGRPLAVRDQARRPGDPPVLVAKADLAAELLGWRAQHSSLERIVRSSVAWHCNGMRRVASADPIAEIGSEVFR